MKVDLCRGIEPFKLDVKLIKVLEESALPMMYTDLTHLFTAFVVVHDHILNYLYRGLPLTCRHLEVL